MFSLILGRKLNLSMMLMQMEIAINLKLYNSVAYFPLLHKAKQSQLIKNELCEKVVKTNNQHSELALFTRIYSRQTKRRLKLKLAKQSTKSHTHSHTMNHSL